MIFIYNNGNLYVCNIGEMSDVLLSLLKLDHIKKKKEKKEKK